MPEAAVTEFGQLCVRMGAKLATYILPLFPFLAVPAARALLEAGEYRADLKKAGFLTRDARAVERKKYGLKKARKRPQFSKR